MNGQRIGYVRVSSLDQNPDRQLEQIPVDRTFADKASGKDVARPELDALLRFARDGDTVVVHSMDRLARNLDDLRRLVRQLTGRGSPTVSFVDTTYLCTNPCNVFHASSASVSPQLSRRVVKKYAMRFRTLVCCFVFCRAA